MYRYLKKIFHVNLLLLSKECREIKKGLYYWMVSRRTCDVVCFVSLSHGLCLCTRERSPVSWSIFTVLMLDIETQCWRSMILP